MKISYLAAILLASPLAPILFAAEPVATNAPAATPPDLAIPVNQIIGQAEAVRQHLRTIGTDLAEDEISLQREQKFDRFEKGVQTFTKESSSILTSNPSLDRVRWLENAWNYISRSFTDHKEDVEKRAETIDNEKADLDKLAQVWSATLRAASINPEATADLIERIRSVSAEIDASRKNLVKYQDKIQTDQKRILELDIRISDMLYAAKEGRKRALEHILDRNVPAIWGISKAGETDETWFSLASVEKTWTRQVASLRAYFFWQQSRFLAHALVLGILIVLTYGLRNYVRTWVQKDPTLAKPGQVIENPIAASFLIALIASEWIYQIKPLLLTACIGALVLIPTVIILRPMFPERMRIVLNALVIFYFFDQLRIVLSSMSVFSRFLFLLETFCALLFFIYTLSLLRTKDESETIPYRNIGKLVAKCAVALLGISLLANILGYGHLSHTLRNGVMHSAYAAVMFYAVYKILTAFIHIASHIPPVPHLGMVRNHGPMLIRRISRLVQWAIVILWISFALEMFSIRTPILEGAGSAFLSEQSLGSLKFRLADILMLIGTIWGAFLLSRFIKFILDADIYPRLKLPHGVPYVISTMLHYLILLVAFLAVAAVLGFDLTKLTILVSAFGVGIGFGLQNIINNFVSGLILLFERPIKVGDSIQIGDAAGIVQRIGIRASVLLTPSGSKVLVPNASLISDRVINWGTSHNQEKKP